MSLDVWKEQAETITQLRSVLSDQEATIKALMSENVEMRAMCDQLWAALKEERDLRIFGQSPECGKTHWESIRYMRREVYSNTDEALAKWREWKEKA